jgi:hypothetical protein
MRRSQALVALLVILLGAGCRSEPTGAPPKEPPPPKEPAKGQTQDVTPTTTASEITITGPSQRAAAVDKMVVVIGIQTRTKQPQVNGIDVDGDYNLSDKKVVARGVLRKTVVAEEPTLEERMHAATRGAGTFYAVIDPETKQLAKTKLAE